jgi:hypothetical protein
LSNEPSHRLNQEIETFVDNRKRDDLLLLYFSGHGIKDSDGTIFRYRRYSPGEPQRAPRDRGVRAFRE